MDLAFLSSFRHRLPPITLLCLPLLAAAPVATSPIPCPPPSTQPPSSTQPGQEPAGAELAKKWAELIGRVEEHRGLRFKRPVAWKYMSEEELVKMVAAGLSGGAVCGAAGPCGRTGAGRTGAGGAATTALTVCPIDSAATCCTLHLGCAGTASPGNGPSPGD